MPAFSAVVAQTCGNIHETSSCSETCARAMQEHASSFGCCWESVMQAYAQIDAPAELAWRSWQGALAGKCDITFQDKGCGDSMGENVYEKLRSEVDALEKQQSKSRQVIRDLVEQTQGAAAQDLCHVDNAWVPCKDASFFNDSGGKVARARSVSPRTQEHDLLSPRKQHKISSEARRRRAVHAGAVAGRRKDARSKMAGKKGGRVAGSKGGATGGNVDSLHSVGIVKAQTRVKSGGKPEATASGGGKSSPEDAASEHPSTKRADKHGSNANNQRDHPGKSVIDVEPDYGVVVSKHASRKESALQKAREKQHKDPAFWPKGLWNAIKPLWPWQKGAFKNVQHAPHLKAHPRSANPLGDRAVKLKHSMQVVDSPLPSETDEPLWGRLEKMATEGIATAGPKSKHSGLWGRSHRWGPSDNDIALPKRAAHADTRRQTPSFGPHRPLVHVARRGEERGQRGAAKKVWVSRNSPWAPDAGFLDPQDPAAKRLSAAGINVNSDMGVI